MVLVQRRALIVVFLLSLAALLLLAVQGYLWLRTAAARPPELLKYRAETVLYLGIVLASVVVAVFLILLWRSRNVSRELDKLIELTRSGYSSSEEGLKKLGPLGRKIRLLYFNLNELNERKSLKISSLSGLLSFVLANTEIALVILDLSGRVEEASRGYLDRRELGRTQLLRKHISEIEPEVRFAEVVSRLEREHAHIVEGEKEKLAFYPVFNRNNELANVVCVPARTAIHTEAGRGTEARPRALSRVGQVMRRYLSSRPPQGRQPKAGQGPAGQKQSRQAGMRQARPRKER